MNFMSLTSYRHRSNGSEQIKKSEQAVMDDDRLTTVGKIKAILIAMPDSYSELDWRQIYQLENSYPRIFARVRVMMEQQWDNTIELLRRGIDEAVQYTLEVLMNGISCNVWEPICVKLLFGRGLCLLTGEGRVIYIKDRRLCYGQEI